MTAADHANDDNFWDEPNAVAHHGTPASATSRQYLMFSVSGNELAAALASVTEIVPYERVSPVPGMPVYVRGVVHVRERVIPVVDLAHKLGLSALTTPKRTSILLLELELSNERIPMGVIMDGVATLLEVDANRIRPAPRVGAIIAVEYIEGLLPTERGMLPLLDFQRVFGSAELERVAAGSGSGSDMVQDAANTNASRPLTASNDK